MAMRKRCTGCQTATFDILFVFFLGVSSGQSFGLKEGVDFNTAEKKKKKKKKKTKMPFSTVNLTVLFSLVI
jgi:hypothetical protein